MNNFQEKLKGLLDAMDVANSDTSASYEEVQEQTVKEILSLIESILHEEKKEKDYETDYEFWERKYWNLYRTQILKAIGRGE